MKEKTCPICRNKFQPSRPMQKVCSPICAYEYGKRQTAKAERIAGLEDRKTIKAQKDKSRKLSYYADKAQAAVNAYRRALMPDEPCISCGKHSKTNNYHAGHFINRGSSPALRYEHLNIWKQCFSCNVKKSGNKLDYRKALVARIGLAKVEWLEGPHELQHWRKEEYLEIEAEHKLLLKELQIAK